MKIVDSSSSTSEIDNSEEDDEKIDKTIATMNGEKSSPSVSESNSLPVSESNSHLMLGIMSEIGSIYNDQLDRLEETALKLGETQYLQSKVVILEKWLSEIGEHNAVLVKTVGELESEATSRVEMLRESLDKMVKKTRENCISLEDHREKVSVVLHDKVTAEEVAKDLRAELKVLKASKDHFKGQNSLLHTDIEALIDLITRARISGVWACDDISFSYITPERVFGPVLPRSGSCTPSLRSGVFPNSPPLGHSDRYRGSDSDHHSICDGGADPRHHWGSSSPHLDSSLQREVKHLKECRGRSDVMIAQKDQIISQLQDEVMGLQKQLTRFTEQGRDLRPIQSWCAQSSEMTDSLLTSATDSDLGTASVQAEQQLSANIDVLASRLSEAEEEAGRCRAEAEEAKYQMRCLREKLEEKESASGGGFRECSTNTDSFWDQTSEPSSPLSWNHRNQMVKLEDEVTSKNILVRELQQHLSNARQECHLKDQTLVKIENKLESLRSDLLSKQQRVTYLETQLESLQLQVVREHTRGQQLQEQVSSKEELLEKIERENWCLVSQLNAKTAGSDHLQETAHQVAQELRERDREIMEQRITISSLQEALVTSKQSNDLLRACNNPSRSKELEDTRQERTRAHAQVMTLLRECNILETQIQELMAENERLKQKEEQMNTKQQLDKQRGEKQNKEMEHMRERIEEGQKMLSQMKKELDDCKFISSQPSNLVPTEVGEKNSNHVSSECPNEVARNPGEISRRLQERYLTASTNQELHDSSPSKQISGGDVKCDRGGSIPDLRRNWMDGLGVNGGMEDDLRRLLENSDVQEIESNCSNDNKCILREVSDIIVNVKGCTMPPIFMRGERTSENDKRDIESRTLMDKSPSSVVLTEDGFNGLGGKSCDKSGCDDAPSANEISVWCSKLEGIREQTGRLLREGELLKKTNNELKQEKNNLVESVRRSHLKMREIATREKEAVDERRELACEVNGVLTELKKWLSDICDCVGSGLSKRDQHVVLLNTQKRLLNDRNVELQKQLVELRREVDENRTSGDEKEKTDKYRKGGDDTKGKNKEEKRKEERVKENREEGSGGKLSPFEILSRGANKKYCTTTKSRKGCQPCMHSLRANSWQPCMIYQPIGGCLCTVCVKNKKTAVTKKEICSNGNSLSSNENFEVNDMNFDDFFTTYEKLKKMTDTLLTTTRRIMQTTNRIKRPRLRCSKSLQDLSHRDDFEFFDEQLGGCLNTNDFVNKETLQSKESESREPADSVKDLGSNEELNAKSHHQKRKYEDIIARPNVKDQGSKLSDELREIRRIIESNCTLVSCIKDLSKLEDKE